MQASASASGRGSCATTSRAGPLAGELPNAHHGAVFMVRGQHLVAGRKRDAPGDGVHRHGGIFDQGQVVAADVEKLTEFGPSRGQFRLQDAEEEMHRIAIQLREQLLPDFQDLLRRGAEGAVIEKRNAGRERPVPSDPGPRRLIKSAGCNATGGHFRHCHEGAAQGVSSQDYGANSRRPGTCR